MLLPISRGERHVVAARCEAGEHPRIEHAAAELHDLACAVRHVVARSHDVQVGRRPRLAVMVLAHERTEREGARREGLQCRDLHAEGRDSFRAMTRRFLLREADDAPELPADADGDGYEGSDGKFDPAAFAGMVARLVENFDTVIDVRQTLARRALGFLKKMRDPEEVERVKAALADQHGIDTELTGDEREADFQAPAAAGAGPTGA